MTASKFLLGEQLVEVQVIENRIVASDDGEEWEVTYEQLEEHYTPVSREAEQTYDIAWQQNRPTAVID